MNNPGDTKSSLYEDVEITGSIKFKGSLSFNGTLKSGEIKGAELEIGPKAQITGNLESGTLSLHGAVTGDVLVTGKCHLTAGAKLLGSLTTNRLSMDDGATFIGQAEITPEGKKPNPPAK